MAHLMLGVLLLLILFLPFFVKPVEKEIEYFLFMAGLLAMTISGEWTGHAAAEAAMEPLKITAAVLVAGILFEVFSGKIAGLVRTVSKKTGTAWFIFIMVILIGFLSSVITAIIAALLLLRNYVTSEAPEKKRGKNCRYFLFFNRARSGFDAHWRAVIHNCYLKTAGAAL